MSSPSAHKPLAKREPLPLYVPKKAGGSGLKTAVKVKTLMTAEAQVQKPSPDAETQAVNGDSSSVRSVRASRQQDDQAAPQQCLTEREYDLINFSLDSDDPMETSRASFDNASPKKRVAEAESCPAIAQCSSAQPSGKQPSNHAPQYSPKHLKTPSTFEPHLQPVAVAVPIPVLPVSAAHVPDSVSCSLFNSVAPPPAAVIAASSVETKKKDRRSLFDMVESEATAYTCLLEYDEEVLSLPTNSGTAHTGFSGCGLAKPPNGIGRAKSRFANATESVVAAPAGASVFVVGRAKMKWPMDEPRTPGLDQSTSFDSNTTNNKHKFTRTNCGPVLEKNHAFTKTNAGSYAEVATTQTRLRPSRSPEKTAASVPSATLPKSHSFTNTNLGQYDSLSSVSRARGANSIPNNRQKSAADSDENWRATKTRQDGIVDGTKIKFNLTELRQVFPRSRGQSDACCQFDAPFESSDTESAAGQAELLPEPYELAMARNLTRRCQFVDTHCHLDFMLDKRGMKVWPWSEFTKRFASSWSSAYEKCFTNFCEPLTFLKPDCNIHGSSTDKAGSAVPLLEKLVAGAPDVYFVFGCHPHFADQWTPEAIAGITERLGMPRVVAVGEMGLDYGPNNNCDRDCQKRCFRQQLGLARTRELPVVIHSRDAEDDCLAILKECLPPDYRIHRHCFLKDMDEAMEWLAAFPNCYFGLTPISMFNTPGCQISFLKKFRLDRILLETDAPYFCPGIYVKKTRGSHPGMASLAAVALAEKRNLPFETVLDQLRENTFNLYSI